MSERDDWGANTAMFRAYVEQGERGAAPATTGRARWILAGVVALVIVVVVAAILTLA